MIRPLVASARRTAASMSSQRLQAIARHMSGSATTDEAVRGNFGSF